MLAATLAVAVGQLLVATSKSSDPDLAKTVVLVVHAGHEGVIGVILNKPVPEKLMGRSTYLGGPVALGVRALIRSEKKVENAFEALAGVWVASEKAVIERHPDARVYAGYVGWSEAQLKRELDAGLWRVKRASPKIVFDARPLTLWERLRAS